MDGQFAPFSAVIWIAVQYPLTDMIARGINKETFFLKAKSIILFWLSWNI